ncbi:HEAT repeat domain-containing protein [Thalassoglobus sp. JC818]|uniref:HEAT repeat domain-containing protein n=1 Tax=Thalassoglobus sp. JC818 TaxID=3232136 RepID=UPI003458A842
MSQSSKVNSPLVPEADRDCPKCGAKIPRAMLRCRDCGTRVGVSNGASSSETNRPSQSSLRESSDRIGSRKTGVTASTSAPSGVDHLSAASSEPKPSVTGRSNLSQDQVELADVGEATPKEELVEKSDRVSTQCGHCQRVVKAPIDLAGAEVRCPSCGKAVRLPKLKVSDSGQSKSSQKEEETPEHVLRRQLAEVVQNAIRETDLTLIESPTSSDQARKGKVKKYVQLIERHAETPLDYRKSKDAREAIRKIVELHSQSGGEAVLGLLPKMSDQVRPDAIRAIGKLRIAQGFEPVLRTLLSSSSEEVEAAIRAAGNFGVANVVLPLLYVQTINPEHRIRIASSIARLGEPALKPLLGVVTSPSSTDALRHAAISALRELKSENSVDALAAILNHDSLPIRQIATEALVEIDDPKTLRPLMKLASDPDPEIRQNAIKGLARSKSKKAAPVLVEALKDPSREVQQNAIIGLGELGDKSFVANLAPFLEGDDQEVQLTTAEAIARLGDKRIVPKLLGLLEKETHGRHDADVLHRLVKVLHKFRDPRSVLPLCELLDSADAKLRRRVVESLGAVGDSAARPALERVLQRDHADDVRASAAKALGDLGDPQAIEVLTSALHETSEVRVKALISLARFKSSNALPVIRDMVIDPLPQVRYQVASLLGEVGDKSAITELEELAADDELMVKRAALKSLETLGDERSEAEIVKAGRKLKKARSKVSKAPMFAGFDMGGLSSVPGGMATVIGGAACVLLLAVYFLFFRSGGGGENEVVVVRGNVSSVGIAEDGVMIVASRNRGMTETWNVSSDERLWSGTDLPKAKGMVVSKGLNQVMVSSAKSALFYDLGSDGSLTNPTEVPGHTSAIRDTVSTSDRRFAATVDVEGIVRIWSLEARNTTGGLTIPKTSAAIALADEGRLLAGGTSALLVWSVETGEIVFDANQIGRISTRSGTMTSVAISPSLEFVAAAYGDGTIVVYDLERQRELSRHTIVAGKPLLVFDEDNELIVVNRKLYRLSDLRKGELQELGRSVESRTSFEYCSKTNQLVMASDEASGITVTDVKTGDSKVLDLK